MFEKCTQCGALLTKQGEGFKCICCGTVYASAEELEAEKPKRFSKGKKCPKCGSTNTDCENNINYCYDCDYEF